MTTSKVEYTQTFQHQLQHRFHCLARHIGPEASGNLLEQFINHFESRVLDHPESAPVCEETADLGLTSYHDYVDPKRQLRVIYRIEGDAGNVVLGMLLLSTRQSIRQALVEYCLRKE